MNNELEYKANLEWMGNKGSGTFDYRSYDRSFLITIKGKPPINGSSESTFFGDNTKHNPQDMFVSAVASCHMLWYLHLCAREGIIVMSYQDEVHGVMTTGPNGGGSFKEILLSPQVKVSSPEMIEKALVLHDRAKEMCYLANSCNFPVIHSPKIEVI